MLEIDQDKNASNRINKPKETGEILIQKVTENHFKMFSEFPIKTFSNLCKTNTLVGFVAVGQQFFMKSYSKVVDYFYVIIQ